MSSLLRHVSVSIVLVSLALRLLTGISCRINRVLIFQIEREMVNVILCHRQRLHRFPVFLLFAGSYSVPSNEQITPK
jgi:hypothetical protein